MKLSARVQALTSSPIRKLSPYADAAKAAGKKVYHLNIGQPDIKTPEQFMDSIRNYDAPVIAYGNSKGEGFLIEAVRKYYADKGMNFATEDIFVTNGGSEALIMAVMALCDRDDEIMVFEPFYANYTTFCKEFGAKINAVPTSVTNGYHLPSQEEIEKHITPKTKAILLTNPGNPTGVVYTPEEQDMISRIVLKYDLALIADEVYREFVYDGEYRSFGTMPELDEHLIIIDSVSKRYSACGARIGCIISKNKELGKQLIKCCQARLCSPILEQVGAAALYTTPVSYLEDVNKEYKKRRDTIVNALAKLPGVMASDPKGAFYIMVNMPVDDAEKFAIWILENFDIDGETVMFAPGNGFYSTPGSGVNEARLAYVLKSEDLERAIYILGEALKAYPGRVER
ncbi:pyridoxal phosphate-dependent aminotransferase [Phascolarctobacterium sp.]|uniref:pyridoxal phosphate-dependent aminotransferase n=1 Tax=Phascolarctobacterium sp. TaxID=2049039 RepID=UPI0038649C45